MVFCYRETLRVAVGMYRVSSSSTSCFSLILTASVADDIVSQRVIIKPFATAKSFWLLICVVSCTSFMIPHTLGGLTRAAGT